jgi:hypothetical protein
MLKKKPQYVVSLYTGGKEYASRGTGIFDALQKLKINLPDINGKTYAKVELDGREKVIFMKPFHLRQIYGNTNPAMMAVVAKRLSLII